MKKTRSRKAKPTAAGALPLAVLTDETALTTLRSQTGLLSRAWGWLQSRNADRADSRRLRVADTVSLGEKRFIAVVQVAGREFLVAGGPSNIALLAQLSSDEPFEDVLRRTITIPGQPAKKRKRAAKPKQKPKQAAKPASSAIDQESVPMNQPQMAQFHMPASSSQVLQKTIKPARKPAAKSKPAAAPANEERNGTEEADSAPVLPPFNEPESLRYLLQHTITSDGNGLVKPAKQQNGRADTEHTGHWA
jgi:flagellar biogenesis protein FliO